MFDFSLDRFCDCPGTIASRGYAPDLQSWYEFRCDRAQNCAKDKMFADFSKIREQPVIVHRFVCY